MTKRHTKASHAKARRPRRDIVASEPKKPVESAPTEAPPQVPVPRLEPGDSSFVISEELSDRRLDALVRGAFDVPWGRAREWISRGKIWVGGSACTDEGAKPERGSVITLRMEAPRPLVGNPIRKEDIAYIDPHLVVVRKPSGLLTVPYTEEDRDTLERHVRHLLTRTPEWAPVRKGSGVASLYIVHRLDRATSGLLVFARTPRARDGLAIQFREHTVLRRYLALAHGDVEAGTHRSHLLVDRGDGIRGSRESAPLPKKRRAEGGKLAITHVDVCERLNGATLIECRLETGRTNQIRIHLSEAGHPIVGETVYMRGFQGPEIQASRLMLHAAQLGFIHPITGQEVSFEEPLPEDMNALLETLRPQS